MADWLHAYAPLLVIVLGPFGLWAFLHAWTKDPRDGR